MRDSLIVSVFLGLFLAVVVYLVGTAITSFEKEDLVWGLLAALVFAVAAFGTSVSGRRRL